MGYSINAIKGISWMSAFRIVTRFFSFIKIGVLARVLTPAQFGVFGIASLILALLEMLTETGINIFLIQSKKEIDEYINSAWVVSIIRGTVISLLVIFSTPFIVLFFNVPEARNIIYLIGIAPFLRGFINPSVVRLQKELKFNYEFWFRTSIFLFDAVISILLAVLTHSVYSLVWGLLAGVVLEVILSFVLIKPIPRFKINKNYFREIFHKGKWVTAYGIFNYFAQEGDNLVVGRLLGTSTLGVYQMAYKISTLPISEVTDVVNKVVFPVYSRIAQDKKRLNNAFIRSTLLITITTLLMGIVVFLFPREIILILLGEKWLSALPVLRVLAIYGVLRAISGSASALFLAVGKQNYVTGMTFLRFISLAVSIYPFVQIFGLVGAAYSALLSVCMEIPLITYYAFSILKTKNHQ